MIKILGWIILGSLCLPIVEFLLMVIVGTIAALKEIYFSRMKVK